MNVPSPILSVLKHHGGQGAEGEAVIHVPAMALAVLEIPVALTETNPLVQITEPQASSVLISRIQHILASNPTATIDWLALRPGLWKLHFWISATTGAENAINDQTIVRIGLEVPRNTTMTPLVTIAARAGSGAVNVETVRVVSLDREAVVAMETKATAVGESYYFEASLLATRLL